VTPHPVAASVEELLAGASARRALKTEDSKSGSAFEQVVIGGESFVVKYLHCDDDWIQRATGDLTCRPLVVWRSGVLAAMPACIDHAVVGCAAGLGRNGWGAALLMRDVTAELVPPGDDPIALDAELAFLDHMAEIHASFWGWADDVGLMPMSHRYLALSPTTAATEAARGGTDAVPGIIGAGWPRFAQAAPRAASVVLPLLDDPSPLVDALAATPCTFLHGDMKLGNLGRTAEGRTVLIDWAVPGAGPGCAELAWYLAINAARLPHSKEQATEAYRNGLERRGIDTEPWWDRQLALSLLGGLVQFGWEKDGDELAWWAERAVEAAPLLS
jgi:hypothetical protein